MELSVTIPALLSQQVATYGSETILRKKDRGIWNTVSWSELDQRVREIGQGLRAVGVTKGSIVAVLSETRPEAVYADLAVLGCGAIGLAIHPDEDVARVGEILRASGAVCVVVEGEEQLDKVLAVRSASADLRLIVIIDMKGLREFNDASCISLTGLIAGGAGQTDWRAVTSAVAPEQTAALIVPPDGAHLPLSHAGIMRLIETAGVSAGVRAGDERLVVSPMSDPTERLLGIYLSLKHRIVSNYLENPDTAMENLREVRPTVFAADAEAWERLHGRTATLAAQATRLQKLLYHWAIRAGAGGGVTGMLANFLVLAAVRAHLGFSRLRVAYVGDRAPASEIQYWASALGITIQYLDPVKTGNFRDRQ